VTTLPLTSQKLSRWAMRLEQINDLREEEGMGWLALHTRSWVRLNQASFVTAF
jgi:hypothetical protein